MKTLEPADIDLLILRKGNVHSLQLSVDDKQFFNSAVHCILGNRKTHFRLLIRYAMDINDPWLARLVRRADAGEAIVDTFDFEETPETYSDDSNEEKIEVLIDLICRAGDEPETKSAALLVLIATVENSSHPKAIATTAKHLVFTRCGELNLYGMVEAQVAVAEGELLGGNTPTS